MQQWEEKGLPSLLRDCHRQPLERDVVASSPRLLRHRSDPTAQHFFIATQTITPNQQASTLPRIGLTSVVDQHQSHPASRSPRKFASSRNGHIKASRGTSSWRSAHPDPGSEVLQREETFSRLPWINLVDQADVFHPRRDR